MSNVIKRFNQGADASADASNDTDADADKK